MWLLFPAVTMVTRDLISGGRGVAGQLIFQAICPSASRLPLVEERRGDVRLAANLVGHSVGAVLAQAKGRGDYTQQIVHILIDYPPAAKNTSQLAHRQKRIEQNTLNNAYHHVHTVGNILTIIMNTEQIAQVQHINWKNCWCNI